MIVLLPGAGDTLPIQTDLLQLPSDQHKHRKDSTLDHWYVL